jgi:preprotein translocase subunit SecA
MPSLLSLSAIIPHRRAERRNAFALERTREFSAILRDESDAQLCNRTATLRDEANDEPVRADFVAEAVALIGEAARRVHGFAPYDCQFLAGLTLSEGRLAEMATGEGKTLVALLPAFRFALHGLGAHVATVNSYLARRDFEFARPAFERLGLTIGLLPEKPNPAAAREAYRCDVTYGVGTDFGFDYLRDQLALRAAGRAEPRFHEVVLRRANPRPTLIQRGHAFAIIDEADSVLIDEARSPLIIAAGMKRPSETPEVYGRADRVARQLAEVEHFHPGTCALTPAGEERAVAQLDDETIPLLQRGWSHYVETALRARHRFRPDVHYVVRAGEVVIVDEFTGRLCPERTWRGGLHQAVEACAGVTITDENTSDATITRPAYFRLYRRVCGMTGTAAEVAGELRASYGLETAVIPLHRPSQRVLLPDRVFATRAQKHAAVARDIWERRSRGQPVLIGTRTIENSEALAEALAPLGFPFRVLNAKQDAEEAAIVEQAGEPGAVTIATNMAGRGAHIPVPEESRRAGGLHVIGLERHESARIDRQLTGRAARQGQPGSAQFFLSLEDDLLVKHAPEATRQLSTAPVDKHGELSFRAAAHFLRAQRKAERLDRDQRHALARNDEWIDELKQAL